MFKSIFHRILLRRHFWRYATFSEVAELYASSMLRKMAINMSAAFMSVFLLQNGYSVAFIAGYWAVYFFLKVFMAIPSARYAAYFGPKHGILISNILYIPALILFSFIPEWGLAAMIGTSLLQGVSATLYNVCYYVNFSKVKSVEHAGKEIAYMNIVEKIATGLSPLVGGVLAFWAGPESAMYAAAALFAIAAVPLLRSGEPTVRRQKLDFKSFPWAMARRSLVAETGRGFDIIASGTIWSLFVAITILGVSGNDVYAKLGLLSSIVLLVALVSSYAYGRLIDGTRGGDLLKFSVFGNAALHLFRPYVNNFGIALGVNVINEVVTTGYSMAFTRGVFDNADISGRRIVYLAWVEIAANLGAAIAGGLLLLLVFCFDDITGMKYFFIATALYVLIIATPKFKLYRK